MEFFGAFEIDESLVQTERFDGGGEGVHEFADIAGNGGVDIHAAAHDHCFGAEFHGLEHGHGGADAVDAGDVATGGHDAAFAAAYYYWLVADIGVVAFFDAGVEGIAIHVGSG